MIDSTDAAQGTERRDALLGRLFQALVATQDLYTIYLGDRLGLYQAMADGRPLTAAGLAKQAGIAERYAREWLEQQAATGLIDVLDAGAPPDARQFRLPEAHREVLIDRDSLNYLGFAPSFAVAMAKPLPQLLGAFRTGGGVPWSAYGDEARQAQADQNRPIFLQLLGQEWLPSIPDLHARLNADPPARVADFACGAGWSSLAIARAYPRVTVTGYDLDEGAIDLGRSAAAAAGLGDRVRFEAADVTTLTVDQPFDLITIFEALHDLSFPVDVLRAMHRLTAPGGSVLVMDERVGDRFTAPADDLERLFYGFSVLCCLPTGLAAEGGAGTGTVMRLATLRRYAEAAGFRAVEVLPIEHDFFRFYRLTP